MLIQGNSDFRIPWARVTSKKIVRDLSTKPNELLFY